jgi:predicted nucleotidyltransferase
MNSVPSVLPKSTQDFFKRIQNDLDKHQDLWFYGSVTRSDYIPNQSDIDVAIFSDNEYSDISKLQNILHVKRNDFDKIVWKLNGQIIYGYKIKVKHINCEIHIYNKDFESTLIDEFTKPLKNQSYLTSFLIYFLKFLYYRLRILPDDIYSKGKRFIMNDLIDKKESVFYLLKNEKEKRN